MTGGTTKRHNILLQPASPTEQDKEFHSRKLVREVAINDDARDEVARP